MQLRGTMQISLPLLIAHEAAGPPLSPASQLSELCRDMFVSSLFLSVSLSVPHRSTGLEEESP